MLTFHLTEAFLAKYQNKKPNWDALGEFVYYRTYSRYIEKENRNEQWWETIKRVVEGVYNTQKDHCEKLRLPWKPWKAQKCLPKGTLIHLKEGVKPIEDIRIGDIIQTLAGVSEVSNVYNQGIQKTIILKTCFGNIECTPNHKVAIFEDSITSWKFKKASEIRIGDRLVFDANGYEGKETKLPISDNIHVPKLDEKIAWLIGEIHGDGYVQIPGKRYRVFGRNKAKPINGTIRLRIEKNRKNLNSALERAKDAFRMFGYKSKVYNYDTWVVKVFSNDLSKYFFNNIKQPNKEINIPDWIISSTRNIRASYLAGLFDADGSYKNRPLIAVCTIYENFAKQVKLLYNSLGICAYIKKIQQNPNNIFQVCLKDYENLKRFKKIIGNQSTKYKCEKDYDRGSKQAHSFKIDTIRNYFGNQIGCDKYKSVTTYRIFKEKEISLSALPIEVVDIEDGRLTETFDIEVKDIKQFTMSGGFVVHNSAQIMYDKIFNFKFSPAGRGLWMMGTISSSINELCFC